MRKRIYIIAVIVFGALLFNVDKVNAEEYSDVEKKVYATALYNCYPNNFKSPIEINDIKNNTNSFMSGNTKVPLINGGLGGDEVGCQILLGNLIRNAGLSIPSSSSSTKNKTEFLKKIGYEKSGDGASEGQCFYFKINKTTIYQNTNTMETRTVDGGQVYTKQVCATKINQNGTIGTDVLSIKQGGGDENVVQFQNIGNGTITLDCSWLPGSTGNCGKHTFQKDSTNWKTFAKEIQDELLAANISYKGSCEPTIYETCSTKYELDIKNPIEYVSYGDATANFKLVKNPASVATKNLLGVSYNSAPSFNNDEHFALYQKYLTGYYGADILCDLTQNEITAKTGAGYREIKYYDGQVIKKCYAKATRNENKKINGIDGNNRFASENCDFNCLTDWLKNSNVKANQLADNDVVTPVEDSEAIDKEVTCMSSGAAKSLGWIACTVLELMTSATEGLYEKYVEPSLRIEPSLFSGNNNSAESQGWEWFRNIANILFVILFLVVIFSQLTGVGIDNYGIKKILPKLIVAAILINLSYLLCMIAIDLSNIVGNGIQNIFNDMGSGLSAKPLVLDCIGDYSEVCNKNNQITENVDFGSGGLVSVSLITTLALSTRAVFLSPPILVSLLVSSLSIAISIFFLFLIMAARGAAVVVLVVIAPLAVACYMLPNTKKYFDRWIKLFGGLLLVYPVCGLLVGGGNYVSKLLLAAETGLRGNGGFFSAFSAMIVGVVPIFFIPTVLKSSFSAMGNLGGKISSIGKQLGQGATNKIRDRDGYKALQKTGKERELRLKAGLDKNNLPNASGKIKNRIASSRVGKALGYQKLQAGRVSAYDKVRQEDIGAAAALQNLTAREDVVNNSGRTTEQVYEERLAKARDAGNTTEMFAVIDAMTRSGMQDKNIADITREVLGSGNRIGNMSDGRRADFLKEFGNRYGSGFLKKDFEQQMWAFKGGVGTNGGVTGVTNYATDNISQDDMKDDDVAALSSGNLASMIAQGKVTQEQAQRVWASNRSMDDTNRLIMGAWGNGGIKLNKDQALNEFKDPELMTEEERKKNPRLISDEQRTAWVEKAPGDVVLRDVRLKDAQGAKEQTDTLRVSLEGSQASGGVVTTSGGSASNASQDSSSTLVNTSSAPADGRAVENETFTVDQTTGTGGNSSRPVVNHLPIPEGWEVDPNYTGNPALINDNNRTGLRRISNPGNGVNTSNRGRDMSGTDWNVPRSNRN